MQSDGYYGRLPLAQPSLLIRLEGGRSYLYRADRDDWILDEEGAFASISDSRDWQRLTEAETQEYVEGLCRREARMHWSDEGSASSSEFYGRLPLYPPNRVIKREGDFWFLYDPDSDSWLPDELGFCAKVAGDPAHWQPLTPMQADNHIQSLLRRQNMRLHQAIRFAALAHRNQRRKSTDLPYIVHPIEVAQILLQADCPTSTIMAGLLHDTVEDTNTSLADLELQFGVRVAQLVTAVSENKAGSWEERKQQMLDTLEQTNDLDVLLLACADKLSNLRSILADHAILGEEVWDRFHRGREQQRWYFSGLLRVLSPLEDYDCYWELGSLYAELFVSYYTNAAKTMLLQTDGVDAYQYTRNDCQWEQVDHPAEAIVGNLLLPLSRDEAIDWEDNWYLEQLNGDTPQS